MFQSLSSALFSILLYEPIQDGVAVEKNGNEVAITPKGDPWKTLQGVSIAFTAVLFKMKSGLCCAEFIYLLTPTRDWNLPTCFCNYAKRSQR